MIRAVTQREKEFAAGQSILTITAHADTARMGIQRFDLRMQFKLIRNQILALLVSKCLVRHVHPVARNNSLNRMVIHKSPGCRINKTVDSIRRSFRQKFNHNFTAVGHMQSRCRMCIHRYLPP